MPVATIQQGSIAHRCYVTVGWLAAAAAIVYVLFAYRTGFAPGSIDQGFRIAQINDLIAYAVAILGLNLVIGFSGQLSLGQSAFVGLGAYITLILVADHQWSYFATLPVAAGVCFFVGLLVGLPALRIRGLYLAVVTLAVAYVFPTLVLKYASLTGGANGKKPSRGEAQLIPPSWMPYSDAGRLAEPLWVYTILIVIATALFVLARNFVRSRPGRALIAVRDNETSATVSGIRPPIYKAMAFGVSAVYGGLAGSMLMMNRPFAAETQFSVNLSIFLVVGLVAGGAGTISGAIPGAFVFLFVPYFVSEWTQDQSGMPPGLKQISTPLFDWLEQRPGGDSIAGVFFGLGLLALMFLLPGGFIDGIRKLRARIITVTPHPRWLDEINASSNNATTNQTGDHSKRPETNDEPTDMRDVADPLPSTSTGASQVHP